MRAECDMIKFESKNESFNIGEEGLNEGRLRSPDHLRDAETKTKLDLCELPWG